VQDAARKYLAAGLSVLPAERDTKKTAYHLSWKQYTKRMPTEVEVAAWFANRPDAICLIAGTASGNLEMIDFDHQADLFEAWTAKIDPALLARLVTESTQSSGRHVAYRCIIPVCGSLKLAQRKHILVPADEVYEEDGRQYVRLKGKAYQVRIDADGTRYVIITSIETRGEGGLFLCSPTPSYELKQGSFADLPVITEAERDSLLHAAWELNEYMPEIVDGPRDCADPNKHVAGNRDRPGDDFNRRGDIPGTLQAHGWKLAKDGENQYWRRPGKTSAWSASLKERTFYVFTPNASPFDADHYYTPFAVYTLLNHGGDYTRAAAALRQAGYGGPGRPVEATANGVDVSGIVNQPVGTTATGGVLVVSGDDEEPKRQGPADPGPLPEELLRVPGFVSELMDYTMSTAPYPNVALSFAAALAMQAFLAGRKVRDPGDNRTNVYLLGLAHSASGKDHPRKVNTRILHHVGMADCLGDRFASGEGLQDALLIQPAMLFQTDEIDGMLQSINKAKDARHEAIMSTLLTMHSASSSVYPMRRKAGQKKPDVIDQPSLVIFGTAIPNHYYEALSERMLTNGFFARMIILESGKRGTGQEPTIAELPPSVLATAKWWSDFRPGMGNLQPVHPEPVIVAYTDQARDTMTDARLEAEKEYDAAEGESDMVGTTVWGRVSEHVRKLALIYACSENHEQPRIGLAAVQWASKFVMHQTRRMLFMAASHVADNPFEAECIKVTQRLREAKGQQLSHSVLLKRMKCGANVFQELICTLSERGDVRVVQVATEGRPTVYYQLIDS